MPRRRRAVAVPLNALRLAVDAHDLVRDDRGIGRYLRAVLRVLAQRDDVALTLLVRDLVALRNRRTLAAALGVARVSVRRHIPRATDVVWHPWNGTFVRTALPSVATIHDVAPFVDPAPGRAALHAQAPFRRSFVAARHLIADSAFTRDELVRVAGLDPARIDVVHLAVDHAVYVPGATADVPPALAGRPFILHVGAHDERKNLPTLLAAWARAWPDGAVRLALTRPLAPPHPNAVVLDGLDERALAAIYRAATVVAVPSTYEGFGLPVLEAMACGTPVIAARAASLPEVGGDAAHWVEAPTDVTQWTTALQRVVNDAPYRADLRARGIERAAGFTWERCAAATLDVLRRVASGT